MLQGNFFTIKAINTAEGTAKALLELNPSHRIFDGHFPGTPVVPGVCMMQMIIEIVEDVLGKDTRLVRADHMKFLSIINPLENKTIEADLKFIVAEDNKISVVASLLNGQVIYFKFKGLLLAP